MRVLIAGGGIGGLAAALSLHAAGIEVEVFEQTPEIKPLGVGINVLPHAMRELTELGLQDRVAAAGIVTKELAYANRFGQMIWSEPRGRHAGYSWPQVSIHRGRLHMELLAAARDGMDTVRCDQHVTARAAPIGQAQRDAGVVLVEPRHGCAEMDARIAQPFPNGGEQFQMQPPAMDRHLRPGIFRQASARFGPDHLAEAVRIGEFARGDSRRHHAVL